MSNFISRGISPETLKASNSNPKQEEVIQAVRNGEWGSKLKNASLRKEKPNWLTTFETVGSVGVSSNEDSEEYKSASTSTQDNEIPNWLVTYLSLKL